MGATIIVDAFWGDAGKGKFSAFLALQDDAHMCVRAGTGTNAGHSVYYGSKLIKCQMLPLGAVIHNTKGLISSGVAVDPNIFVSEINTYHVSNRIYVDRRCPIIEDSHINYEKSDYTMRLIDSTKSGSGKARADFVMREARQAKNISVLEPYLIDGITELNNIAKKNSVIVEGSQGTFLSLYASDRYPYVTSDNCTTAAFLDDISLNWQYIERVLLLIKCLPTSIGHGPLPYEMTENEITESNLAEFGVNTGRPKRRSRKIDWSLLKYSIMINGPTELALTFCDQMFSDIRGTRTKAGLKSEVLKFVDRIEDECGVRVTYMSTGPDVMDVITL